MARNVPFIKLNPAAARAIKSFMAANGIQKPIRIDLGFEGCCDPALVLRVDDAASNDLRIELEGLAFIISPETYELAGGVRISHVADKDRQGFIVTASKPISEWNGIGVCNIKR